MRNGLRRAACLCFALLLTLSSLSVLADEPVVPGSETFAQALAADALTLTPDPTVDPALLAKYAPVSLSPDGSRMLASDEGNAVVINLADGSVLPLQYVDPAGSEDRPLQYLGDDLAFYHSSWSVSGRWLTFSVYSQSHGGKALHSLWLADLSEGTVRTIEHSFGTPTRAVFDTVEPAVLYYEVIDAPPLFPFGENRTLFYRYMLEPEEHLAMAESMVLNNGNPESALFFDGTSIVGTSYGKDGITDGLYGPSVFSLTVGQAIEVHVIQELPLHSSYFPLIQLADVRLKKGILLGKDDSAGITFLHLEELNAESFSTPYRIDPALLADQRLTGQPQFEGIFSPAAAAFSPDARYVALYGALQDQQPALYLVDVETNVCGQVALQSPVDNITEGSPVEMQWAEGNRLLVRTGATTQIYTFSTTAQ